MGLDLREKHQNTDIGEMAVNVPCKGESTCWNLLVNRARVRGPGRNVDDSWGLNLWLEEIMSARDMKLGGRTSWAPRLT